MKIKLSKSTLPLKQLKDENECMYQYRVKKYIEELLYKNAEKYKGWDFEFRVVVDVDFPANDIIMGLNGKKTRRIYFGNELYKLTEHDVMEVFYSMLVELVDKIKGD